MADLDHDGIPAGEDPDDVWETGLFMSFAYGRGWEPARLAVEMLADNLEALNEKFDIDVVALAWPVMTEQWLAGAIPLYPLGWVEDYHHPHNWVQPYLDSNGAFGRTLGLPQDVQAEAWDYPVEFFAKRVHRPGRRPLSPGDAQRAARLIKGKKKPMIICGGGVRYSGAGEELATFAADFDIPIAETQAGKGVLLWNNSLNIPEKQGSNMELLLTVVSVFQFKTTLI